MKIINIETNEDFANAIQNGQSGTATPLAIKREFVYATGDADMISLNEATSDTEPTATVRGLASKIVDGKTVEFVKVGKGSDVSVWGGSATLTAKEDSYAVKYGDGDFGLAALNMFEDTYNID